MSEAGRLRWRCRRGMKELDVLLSRYLEERFEAAPPAEQRAFEALLDVQDPQIYAYCLGQVPIPADLAPVIERMTSRPSG